MVDWLVWVFILEIVCVCVRERERMKARLSKGASQPRVRRRRKDCQFIICCSAPKSCPTLCNRMDCSTPGFPVLHYLPEFAQTHVHWVCDAIQPSHPLSSPSPAFNSSQHQEGFFFSSDLALHIRRPKYWSFSFSISPFNEYSYYHEW